MKAEKKGHTKRDKKNKEKKKDVERRKPVGRNVTEFSNRNQKLTLRIGSSSISMGAETL
jgi:hypothetical protein